MCRRIFVAMAVVGMLVGAVACGRSAPTPTFIPTAEATAVPTFTPTVAPTSTPDATPTPTATPGPVALWVHPAVPAAIRDLRIESGRGLQLVSVPEEAEAKLVPVDVPTSLEWVLVPVVPFPTLADDVSWRDIVAFWQGDAQALSYLGGETGPPTLFCTEEVDAALRVILGEPSADTPIMVTSPETILDEAWQARPAAWGVVPFDALEPRWKVLRLDGVNVLERGLVEEEYPLALHFDLEGAPATSLALPQYTNRDENRMTILVMTGVTALVRCTADRMEERGVLYPAEYVGEVLRSADIAHISNEVPFADNCPPPSCQQESLVFCSSPAYLELLRAVGTDIVELTGNHFQDYGSEATLMTVAMYDGEGWPHYGGGVNLEDARKPVILTDHGNSLSFMGCNPVGPEFAWADEERPGAAPCDFEYMHIALGDLAASVDVPIVTWQYWEFYHYEPTPQQREDFRGMVDAGAKIVSGSQAHHPQAMEFYNGGFIHYGLGNLFFDQMWSLETRQECVDRHVIYDGRHISTEILTYMLEDWAQPRPMTDSERRELLTALFRASGW